MWGCCFPLACAKLSAYLRHPAPDMDEQGLPRLCIASHAVLQNRMAFKSLHILTQNHTHLGMLNRLSCVLAEPFGHPTNVHMQDIL